MIRNILKYLIIFIILSGFSGLAAAEFLNNIEEGEINGFPTIKGTTDSGVEVTIIEMAPLSDPELQARIERLLGSFSVIPVRSVRITNKPSGITELFISNESFSWNGYDMAEYLPSGFTLMLDGSVDYDADLFVNRMRIRLEGFFRSEEVFLDTVTSVVDDPGTFLMSRDPEYILNTFLTMMGEDERIQQELNVQKEQSVEQGTQNSQVFESLKNEIAALEAQNEALRDELTELKYNNLIMENRSLFGSIKMIDRDAVDWIVEKKTANPAISGEELGTQLTSETGVELSSKSIAIILGLYFGEYAD